MNLTTVKRMVGQCSDEAELRSLIRHINGRIDTLKRRAWKKKQDDQWQLLKSCTDGQVLYCCIDGHFMGGDIQRGSKFIVSHVQPRAKRVWFYGPNGEQHFSYLDVAGATRYKLRKDPPENPATDRERAVYKRMGERLQEALS